MRFPKKNSLTGRALALLLSGNKITHREFQNRTASYRLSAFILRLRQQYGFNIITKIENGYTKDIAGRKADYGIYFFDETTLNNLRSSYKEEIKDFIEGVKAFEGCNNSVSND